MKLLSRLSAEELIWRDAFKEIEKELSGWGSRLKEPAMAQASLKTVKACQEKIVTGTEEIDALRKKLEKLLQKTPKGVNCPWIAKVYLWWSAEMYEYRILCTSNISDSILKITQGW